MSEVQECVNCKKNFVPTNPRQIFCCKECQVKCNARERMIYKAAERKQEKERLKQMEPKRSKKPKYSVTELAVAARKEGLSYGQYVAKYGL